MHTPGIQLGASVWQEDTLQTAISTRKDFLFENVVGLITMNGGSRSDKDVQDL